VTILSAVEAAVIAHARAAAPDECCGLLLGDAETIRDCRPARNITDQTVRRYLIEPVDHLAAIREARRRSIEVIGAYHSHPRSAAIPSPTDADEAFGEFLFLIVGLRAEPPDLRAWRWDNGNFTEVRLVRAL
jgi:proteasome lid subunit RPN8/RPN11